MLHMAISLLQDTVIALIVVVGNFAIQRLQQLLDLRFEYAALAQHVLFDPKLFHFDQITTRPEPGMANALYDL